MSVRSVSGDGSVAERMALTGTVVIISQPGLTPTRQGYSLDVPKFQKFALQPV